jgi:hypothetical protein
MEPLENTMKMRSKSLWALAVFCLLLFATNFVVSAQETDPRTEATPSATESPSPAAATPSPSPVPTPRVYEVEGNLQLDSIVRVKVDRLKEWDQHSDKNDPIKLIPYINGRAIHGVYPEEVHGSYYNLHYHLEINEENQKVWTDLLGEPAGTRRPVTFSVGLENQTPFDTEFGPNNQKFLTVISPLYGVIALLVVLFTLILFLWLARKTNIIRETGDAAGPGKLRPYNLGRTQMAFWFFLIYTSYLVVWVITGALDTITASLLGLMGISAGTALGEALIDSGKEDARSDQLQNLSAERQTLEQNNAELQAQLTAINQAEASPDDLANRDRLNKQVQDNRTRLAAIDQQTQSLTPRAAAGVSSGFLKDILSDGSGYSFHRFQIFAWTIVLGIIFLSSVYNSLSMPEFSATLLGLMGLSSGTYIGFKFPEQK